MLPHAQPPSLSSFSMLGVFIERDPLAARSSPGTVSAQGVSWAFSEPRVSKLPQITHWHQPGSLGVSWGSPTVSEEPPSVSLVHCQRV